MGRAALRRWGAIVLGCVFLWAGATSAAAPAPPGPLPPHAVLSLGGEPEAALDGRSRSWMDESGAATADFVEAHADELPWRVRRRDSQSGLHGALWITFDAEVPAGTDWFLEVAASFHEKVQLFHRDAKGQWVVQQAGTSLPVWQWAVPGRLPVFRLATDRQDAVRYFLRVEDARADFLAPLALLRVDALQERREREQFVFGAYFGLLGLIAIASLVNGVAFRDKAFLAFTLHIVLLGLGQLSRVGVGPQHLWGEWQEWNQILLTLWPGAATAALVWLVKILADPARLSRLLDAGVWGLIAALLAATALNVVVNSRLSMTVVLSLTGLGLVAVLAMVLWAWLDAREHHLTLLAVAFIPLVTLAAFPLARSLGLLPTNILTRFGLFLATTLQLPLLYYAINTRLMARREGELRAAALSRTDPLTGLPHRHAMVERLDSSLAHARGQKQQCALLGVRIANLDALTQEFGRDAKDKALVVAGSELRQVIVGYDMAARVDEREFAVLIEAPTTQQLASSRAQQVVASGLRQIPGLPAALTLKFHVTIAMLPQPQLDGAASLQWALDGLDGIEPDAKKLIRSLDSVH